MASDPDYFGFKGRLGYEICEVIGSIYIEKPNIAKRVM
jgi:hypothetical protein